MRIASKAGVPVVYNPAPAGEGMPEETYRLTTLLCPNEHEASRLTGRPVNTNAEAETAARELMSRGVASVIVTLGERGCLVVTKDIVELIPAPAVQTMDTTGAGDAFIGSLGFFLARGDDLVAAAQRAVRIASESVRFPGTQSSFPGAAELSNI
jgi:ribokinase